MHGNILNLYLLKKGLAVLLMLFSACSMSAQNTRLIVSSDIGGSDPDDQQSLVHLLVSLDRVDLEGFIYQHAWDSYNVGNEMVVTDSVLNAYGKVWKNLRKHSKRFPSEQALRKLFKRGQLTAGMAGIGEGKDTSGSEWIIHVVDKADKRPVWIAAWSGTNTLAQALWKIRATRSESAVKKFISKIRVYDILGQDDAGAWIVTNFPDLIYIRNKAVYGWPPSDEWVSLNVQVIGPLGRQYPNRIWATEGDSPSFFYVLNNGLNAPEYPHWGGWGGRFDTQPVSGIRSMDWVVKNGLDEVRFDPYYMLSASAEEGESIWRWKQDIYNDFAARMQWTMADDYAKANHHPVVVTNGSRSTTPLFMKARSGDVIQIDASKSFDPDGDALTFEWSHYKEPSTYKGPLSIHSECSKASVQIPNDASGLQIHLILKVSDNGNPMLVGYRRIIIDVAS
jgi:hypothetical protein